MRKARRGRRLGVGVAGTLAALAMMAFGATAAKAVPFQAEMDNAFLKTGAFPPPGLDILNPTATPPAVPPARIGGDLLLGAPSTFTVPAGCDDITAPPVQGFCFPEFSGTVLSGAVGVKVNLTSLQPITGTVDAATGAVTTNPANFTARLVLDFTPGNTADPTDTCDITPISLAFNTNQPFPAPYAGDPFTVDVPNLATDGLDDGAISTTWATLPTATTVPPAGPNGCSTVDSLSSGRGGIWIADNIATPVLNQAPVVVTPPPTTTPPKKAKKCKKAKKKAKKGASAAKKCKKAKKKK